MCTIASLSHRYRTVDMSRATFFEVEVLDAKSRQQLCFLDKVEPYSTIADIKSLVHKLYPQWYPARQALKLDPKARALRDDDVLQNLPVGTTATMYFRDLGPQLGWTMRLVETIFVHRFSHGTMPLRTIARLCEVGNFSIHLTLNSLRGEGTKYRRFPVPNKNPFTWLFFFVSCPNYTYEVGAWLGFSIMTQCLPVALYTLLGFIQMSIWARGKHRAYTREFKAYPGLRMSIIPLVL
ncbi:hypothetical protein CRUP_022523 [Coryphaenoides rupestris]|nr:hypothetical protein CRUP_022523 [Coryphaenoides rupestris]